MTNKERIIQFEKHIKKLKSDIEEIEEYIIFLKQRKGKQRYSFEEVEDIVKSLGWQDEKAT